MQFMRDLTRKRWNCLVLHCFECDPFERMPGPLSDRLARAVKKILINTQFL